jgi:hypothetical protein
LKRIRLEINKMNGGIPPSTSIRMKRLPVTDLDNRNITTILRDWPIRLINETLAGS